MKTSILTVLCFILVSIKHVINTIDELEVDLRTNCVTHESLEFAIELNEIVSEHVAEKIAILKEITEKCARFEQIDGKNSPNDLEFNQNKVEAIDLPYESPNSNWNFDQERHFFQEILFNKNISRFNFKDFAWTRYEKLKNEKNAVLKWVRHLNSLRLKRIKRILRTKMGAKIFINQPGYVYDNIEINDLLEALEMSSKGETLYSYAQLSSAGHELETMQMCAQLAYLVCDRSRNTDPACDDFFATSMRTSNYLFELKLAEPMSDHFGSSVVLFYDLYRLKGEKGVRGCDGQRGEKGKRGRKGYSGEKGDRGNKGDKGYDGDSGDVGERGDDIGTMFDLSDIQLNEIVAPINFDLTGPKGRNGSRGTKGSRGYKGMRGEKGSVTTGQQSVSKPRFRGAKGDKGVSDDSAEDRSAYFWFNDAPADGVSVNIKSELWSVAYRQKLFNRLQINRLMESLAHV